MSDCNHTTIESCLRADECAECLRERAKAHSLHRPGSADGVISNEVESLLINVAQILDVVKTEWAESWSAFDQEQRDHITKLLMRSVRRTLRHERPPTKTI